MDTKWLEDFVSVASTRSFSQSANLRHVTQPAFSRRIQSLEDWAGAALIDRGRHPMQLTPAGELLYPYSLQILRALLNARAALRGSGFGSQDVVELVAPPTIAAGYFPGFISDVQHQLGTIKTRLLTQSVEEGVSLLNEAKCDLLLTYFHESQPLPLARDRYEWLTLGVTSLAPYCRDDGQGEPAYRLDGQANAVPYLAYTQGSFLGRIVESALQQADVAQLVECIYETDSSEGLRAMATQGHGVAFLLEALTQSERRRSRLVAAAPQNPMLNIPIELRIYREMPVHGNRRKPAAQALWSYLARKFSPGEDAQVSLSGASSHGPR